MNKIFIFRNDTPSRQYQHNASFPEVSFFVSNNIWFITALKPIANGSIEKHYLKNFRVLIKIF